MSRLTSLLWRTWHRTANRWWDWRARKAGYCNHRPWSPIPSQGGGYASWRCALDHNHPSESHRLNNYVWGADGCTRYVPIQPPLPTQPWDRHMIPTIADTRRRKRWLEKQRLNQVLHPNRHGGHQRWADLTRPTQNDTPTDPNLTPTPTKAGRWEITAEPDDD